MSGKARLITVIPVCNSQQTLSRTLASLTSQTTKPDRVVLLDFGSTDATERVPAQFANLHWEWQTLPPGHKFFDACNAGLHLAANTRHLHLLRCGDILRPTFYESLLSALGNGDTFGLAYCLDETADVAGERLFATGWQRKRPTRFSPDAFLRRMSRLETLPLSTALIRTGGHRVPVRFRVEISMLAHKGFWASFAAHCDAIVRVNQHLCVRQWEPQGNGHQPLLPGMQALVYDEVRVMQNAEHLRANGGGWVARQRRLWILSRRAALKARRAEQMHKPYHAREIARACRDLTGWWRWLPAKAVVVARDWLVFGALRRRRDPRDLYR